MNENTPSTPKTTPASERYSTSAVPQPRQLPVNAYLTPQAKVWMWILGLGFPAFGVLVPLPYHIKGLILIAIAVGGIIMIQKANRERPLIQPASATPLPALPAVFGSKWTGQIIFEKDGLVFPGVMSKKTIPYQEIVLVDVVKVESRTGANGTVPAKTMLQLYRSSRADGPANRFGEMTFDYVLSGGHVLTTHWPVMLALLQIQAPQADFSEVPLQIIQGVVPSDFPQ
ncbi:MAG TPA: hypothetical protein VGB77_08405 [Abditibacteriaceae bacterium]|jgi:hypothetical protein